MADHEVFSEVTGGCSLPQLWVGEPLVRQSAAKAGTGGVPSPTRR